MKNLTATLVLFSLLVGVLLTIWGFTQMQWPQAPLREGVGALFFCVWFLVCAALASGGFFWSKNSPLLIGGVVAIGFALMAGALWPLLVILWFAIASVLAGRYLLAALRIKVEEDNWLTNLLVGAGVYGTAVGLLAHSDLNYPGVYGAALALPLMVGWRVVAAQAKNLLALVRQENLAGLNVNRLDVAIAVVALIYFIVALMPETGFDALWQHLFVSAHLAARHKWGFDAATYVWAVIPMLGDWIFAIGYMLAGETAARLINVGFIFILGWLVRDLVLWAGGSAIGARWAVLVFLSTPLTFIEGSSLFIESVLASLAVAGTLAVFRACSAEEDKRSQLIIAGLLLGCALATKSVTFLMLPALLLVLVWRYKNWLPSNTAGTLALGLGLFLMMGSVPYIGAWWLTGNPVFPYFNKIFQSPLWPPINFEQPTFGKGTPWDVLYQVTFHSDKYLEAHPGASGFQWLILFLPTIAILLLRKQLRGIALLFVGIASVIAVFHSTAYLRYIFPACVLLIAAIGAAMSFDKKENIYVIRAFAFMGLVVTLVNLAFMSTKPYADFPLKTLIDGEKRRQYLFQRFPVRSAIELVNRLNIQISPVAVFAAPVTAGIIGDALYTDWTNVKFQTEINTIKTEQDLANILVKRGVDFVILDSNWNCCSDSAEKKAIIEKVTRQIAEYSSISVRKIKPEYRFREELIVNPSFTSINGWVLAPGARYDAEAGIILASERSNATQAVSVSPGRHYLNTVVERCAAKTTLGRMQINWLDDHGKFINADGDTFECYPDWTEHTMEVTAPPNAKTAIVYTVGHTLIPLEFKSNSLRQ